MTYTYKMPIAQGYKVIAQEEWCHKITLLVTWDFKVGNIAIWIRTYMARVDQNLFCPVCLKCVRSLYLLIWVTQNSHK